MVMAARASAGIGLCSDDDIERIVELLTYFDLPVTPPDYSVKEYLSVMQRDKKVKDGVVRVVLNHGIGTAELHQVEDLDKLLGELLT
jgi:3-dehydroquinate synthase